MLTCVVGGVMVYNSSRHRKKLTRSGVLSAKQSPWTHCTRMETTSRFKL